MKKFRGLGFLIFLAVFAATTAVVMLLWNSVAVYLFEVPPVNFWYAAGLIILSKLLLGGFRSAHDFFHTHRHHLSRGSGPCHPKAGHFCGDDHDHLREMHEKFHSMGVKERREYIRNHMASAFHREGPTAGKEPDGGGEVESGGHSNG